MGLIKSAVELAMERSEGLQIDKEELRKKEAFNRGRAAAAQGLSEDLEHFNQTLKTARAQEKDHLETWFQGAGEVFLGRFTLPAALSESKDLTKTTGFLDLLTQGKSEKPIREMAALLTEYATEVGRLKEAIAAQMGPRLQQMAQQQAQQKGVALNYVLEKDPNYQKILAQNLEPIQGEFQNALEDLKGKIRLTLKP